MASASGWKKGQSGNPKGRPKKGQTMTDLLETELSKKGLGGNTSFTARQAVVQKLLRLATDEAVEASTRLAAIKYIFDRLDGRPEVTQKITADDAPQVVIIHDNIPPSPRA